MNLDFHLLRRSFNFDVPHSIWRNQQFCDRQTRFEVSRISDIHH